jgi:hypothetical protein
LKIDFTAIEIHQTRNRLAHRVAIRFVSPVVGGLHHVQFARECARR